MTKFSGVRTDVPGGCDGGWTVTRCAAHGIIAGPNARAQACVVLALLCGDPRTGFLRLTAEFHYNLARVKGN